MSVQASGLAGLGPVLLRCSPRSRDFSVRSGLLGMAHSEGRLDSECPLCVMPQRGSSRGSLLKTSHEPPQSGRVQMLIAFVFC